MENLCFMLVLICWSTKTVDAGWSEYSTWGECSATCIKGPLNAPDVVYPTRSRHRTCLNPSSTSPPGNECKGAVQENQNCSELPNCPVDGGWGPWGPPGPCSVSCGEGLRLTSRSCDNPAPQYGGQTCQRPGTRATVCMNTCPVHGSWTGWSPWGNCSASCNEGGSFAVRRRFRSCSNPAPSSNPTGNSCPGEDTHTELCDTLPSCPDSGKNMTVMDLNLFNLGVGAQLEITGRIANDITWFAIYLGTAPSPMGLGMYLRVDPGPKQTTFIFSTWSGGRYGVQERQTTNSLKPGQEIKIVVKITEDEFRAVLPDGKEVAFPNRLGLKVFSYVGVHGVRDLKMS